MYYILAALLLWSSLGIIIRLSGVPVLILILVSSAVSSVILGTMFVKKHYRDAVPRGKSLVSLGIIGPLSLANSFTFFYAYQNTTVANAVLTHYTAPVIVAFLAPMILKERLTMTVIIAVGAATAGLWIMLDVSVVQFLRATLAGDRNSTGILSGLCSGFIYAVLIILFRIFAQQYPPLIMTFLQNLTVTLIILPFARMESSYASALWAFAAMGVIHSTIAPLLYFRGMREVTANRAAILGYLEPVAAILLGALFLNEGLDSKTLIGGSLIIFSGYLTMRGYQ